MDILKIALTCLIAIIGASILLFTLITAFMFSPIFSIVYLVILLLVYRAINRHTKHQNQQNQNQREPWEL